MISPKNKKENLENCPGMHNQFMTNFPRHGLNIQKDDIFVQLFCQISGIFFTGPVDI